jgi:site-specific recombinase XerD
MSFIYYDNTKKRNVFSYSVKTSNGTKRKRLFFKTKKGALECKKAHDSNQRSYGKVANFDLEKYQKFLMLEEYADGIDLVKAIDHYKSTYRVATDRKFSGIIKLYLNNKKSKNVGTEWISTLKGYLEKLTSRFRSSRIDKITKVELEEFISSLPYSISYKDNIRRVTQNLFKYAVSIKWCKDDPAKDLEPFLGGENEVKFISACDTKKLFNYLENNNKSSIPFNALRAFAGMRTSYAKRILWSDVSFEERGIRVESVGKSQKDFLQGFPENLWVWLTKYRSQPIKYPKVDRETGAIIKELSLDYPRNGFRHAFGTYHVALFKDASLTAHLMQHRGTTRTLHKFYKGVSSESDATDFFKLLPTN